MRYLYTITDLDMGESDKYDFFTSRILDTYGDNFQELLDNATYFYIDQDGGEVGDSPADDKLAIRVITEWYEDNKCPEMEHPIGLKDPMTLAKQYKENLDD